MVQEKPEEEDDVEEEEDVKEEDETPVADTVKVNTSMWRSHRTEIGLFVFAFLTISLASGTVYGWPSLRRQLVQELEQQQGNASNGINQESSMAIIYTCGASATQACRFFFGVSRDHYLGTKLTTCISLIFVMAGSLGIAFSEASNVTALSISMFFMGLGSGTQLSLQPVAGLFQPDVQGLLISSLSGAFQLAGLVFLVLTAITTDRKTAFGAFAAMIMILIILSSILLPWGGFGSESTSNQLPFRKASPAYDKATFEARTTVCAEGNNVSMSRHKEQISVAHKNLTNFESSVGDSEATQKNCTEAVSSASSSSDSLREDKTVAAQMLTHEYVLLVVWFSVALVPLQYYIGTIGFQLDERGDVEGKFTALFSIMYAASAGVAPFLGKIVDLAGLGISQGIATLVVALSFFLLASTTISLEAQAVGMGFYGIGRMMIFGTYFTNIGKRFGYRNYGTLSGLGLLCSGIVSLLQYPLISTATSGSHSGVDIGCGIAMIAMLPYCLWLAVVERR